MIGLKVLWVYSLNERNRFSSFYYLEYFSIYFRNTSREVCIMNPIKALGGALPALVETLESIMSTLDEQLETQNKLLETQNKILEALIRLDDKNNKTDSD